MACLHVCAVNGARAQRPEAHVDRRAVRAAWRFSHRRNLRLHGGADRRLEQPNFGRRHSFDRALCINTHRRRIANAANVGVVAPNPLPAPQATLISALAQGVVGGNLDWKMIGIGALVGVGLILLDTTLGTLKKLRFPPLAVGIGIYLPMSATFAVVVGAVLSHWYDRRTRSAANPGRAERLGTLVASG